MTRLLYILPGLVPPDSTPSRDKFHYLSEVCGGEILLPVWWRSAEQVSPHLRPSFPTYSVGKFSYQLFLFLRFPRPLRKIATFLWYLTRGIQLHRKTKIDVIVTYGTNMPAVAGTILKWLTGAKLVVEIPGVPENAFRYDTPNPGKRTVVKRFFADRLLYFTGRASDCFKLLYPWQLHRYPSLQRKHAVIFHDFVPVRCVKLSDTNERFILSVGYPWYTKGVDILIRAFKLITNQFPEYKLKFIGYCPDRRALHELAQGCPQIEILGALPNELALQAIAACTIYVLASRTEGAGRVILEAMAAGRPIIASAVGGVPYYVRNNDNGLLFPSENVEELAAMMVRLLTDKELRTRLGRRGYERVFSEFDETTYQIAFKSMLQSIQVQSLSRDAETDGKEEPR